jgi:hypothetical protein
VCGPWLLENLVDDPLKARIKMTLELVDVQRDNPISLLPRRVDRLFAGARVWARGRQRSAFRAFISGGRGPLPHAVSAAAAVDVRVGDVGSALGRHFKRWEIERLLECAYSGWR